MVTMVDHGSAAVCFNSDNGCLLLESFMFLEVLAGGSMRR